MGSRYFTTDGQLMQYTLPSVPPAYDGQVLASSGAALVWSTGGGDTTVDGTPGQIAVTATPNTFKVALDADYYIPQTLGSAGQALVVPASGDVLTWATVGGGGGGSGTLEGTASEIVVTTVGDVSQIGLDPTRVVVPALLEVGGVTFPSGTGAIEGQVLTIAAGGVTAVWGEGGSGGGTVVQGTIGEIAVTNTGTDSIISLASNTLIGGVEMPPKSSAPSVGQVLTVSGTGPAVASWASLATGTTTISGTANEIAVNTVSGAATVSLPAAITAPGSLSVTGALSALTIAQAGVPAFASAGPISLNLHLGNSFVASVQCKFSKVFDVIFLSIDWNSLADVTGAPVVTNDTGVYFTTDYTGDEPFFTSANLPSIAASSWTGQSVLAGTCGCEVWHIASPGAGDSTANVEANFSIVPGIGGGQFALQVYLSDDSGYSGGFGSDYAFRFMGESANTFIDVPNVLQLVWH